MVAGLTQREEDVLALTPEGADQLAALVVDRHRPRPKEKFVEHWSAHRVLDDARLLRKLRHPAGAMTRLAGPGTRPTSSTHRRAPDGSTAEARVIDLADQG